MIEVARKFPIAEALEIETHELFREALTAYSDLLSARQSFFLLFHITALSGSEIDKPLFEQGFFDRVNTGGTKYVLYSGAVGITRNVK